MRTPILGYAKVFLTMFIKKKKNRSGTTSIVVAEKTKGNYKELVTIGIAKDANDIDSLVNDGREWISKEESRRHPQLDLYGEEREACDREREEVRRVLSNVSNTILNGCDLILDRIFDRIGFNRIDDEVFRKLVKARLAYPTSKAATVEYLKNHFDEDVYLSKSIAILTNLATISTKSYRTSACAILQNCSVEISVCCSMMSPHFTLKRITRTTCARQASRRRDFTVILRSYSACL